MPQTDIAGLVSTKHPTPDPAVTEGHSKEQFLWHIHAYLNEYARFGDAKAAFGGTAAGTLLAVLYGAKAHIPLLAHPFGEWPISSFLLLFGSAFLVTSFILAAWVIVPRLRSTQTKGLIFWGNIAAHKDIGEFQASFHGQSQSSLNDHLLHHVYDLSTRVCVPKYRYVSLCIWALVVGSVLGSAGLLLRDGSSPSSGQAAVNREP